MTCPTYYTCTKCMAEFSDWDCANNPGHCPKCGEKHVDMWFWKNAPLHNEAIDEACRATKNPESE